MQTCNVDIYTPTGPLAIYAKQGDSMSRFFALALTDSGAPYEPPEGVVFSARFGAPGMPGGWYDTITDPDGSTHSAFEVNGNIITVELAEQAISAAGKNALCVLMIAAKGFQLSAWNFDLLVEHTPGADEPEATIYYNLLTEQVNKVLKAATDATASATAAESWAVGGTGSRPGEDTDNAKYWAEEAQKVAQGGVGWYETPEALRAAHPTGKAGDWAIVGSTDTIWIWDVDGNDWKDTHGNVNLSDYYTKTEADARFATAAQGAKADAALPATGTAADSSKLGGQPPEFYQSQEHLVTLQAGSWAEAADGDHTVYTQTIEIAGFTESTKIVPTRASTPTGTLEEQLAVAEELGYLSKYETVAGGLKVTCVDDVPTLDLPLVITEVR